MIISLGSLILICATFFVLGGYVIFIWLNLALDGISKDTEHELRHKILGEAEKEKHQINRFLYTCLNCGKTIQNKKFCRRCVEEINKD